MGRRPPGRASVFFRRNAKNEEVDFVLREGLDVTELIQVCRDAGDPKALNREIRALLKAGSELKRLARADSCTCISRWKSNDE